MLSGPNVDVDGQRDGLCVVQEDEENVCLGSSPQPPCAQVERHTAGTEQPGCQSLPGLTPAEVSHMWSPETS